MAIRILFVLFLALTSFTTSNKKSEDFSKTMLLASTVKSDVRNENSVEGFYNTLNSNNFEMPSYECFSRGLQGFNKLKATGRVTKEYLTIVDYSLPSTVKRLWIIDVKERKIIMNSLVAHGKNSGQNYATSFSNKSESNKSSLGFFITGETYMGKHGLSLKLDGMENGINDRARDRAIVMHAADYVTEDFARTHHRLGLSHGCPALPPNLSAKIIAMVKGKSCLFIYHPSMSYNTASKLIA